VTDTPAFSAPAKPKGLGIPGSRLWRGVTQAYVLRVDELILLESACRTADTISRLDLALVDEPLVVKGSMGQEREHPLLSEVRQQRAALARLLVQLKLPEDATAATGAARAGERSAAARTLAHQRWSSAGTRHG